MMTRAERRAQTERIKSRYVRLVKAGYFGARTLADDPKWVGKTAAMHCTCDCWMCTTPELRHRRPEPSRDPELEGDWVYERYADAKEARAARASEAAA